MSLPTGAVDCHAHVMLRDAPLVANRHSKPERDVSVDEFLAVLDAHDVGHGVLTAPSFYGPDNSILLQALRAHPKRLRGTVTLDPEAMPDLDAMARDGVVGVRLNWTKRDRLPNVSSSAYGRMFDAVRSMGWHLELFLEGERLPDVLPFLQRTGKLVLDHFGCPDPALGVTSAGFQTVLASVREGSTWVKLSAPYRLRGASPQPYVDALMEAGGPQRLLWASDWPWIGHEGQFDYATCLGWLNEWVCDAHFREEILVTSPIELGLAG
jgi:predicted TIM-barrel fold metal-dependent hydrolase